MALTLSGTNGVVGAGFTLDASGASVTAGVGTFGSLNAPAAGLTGALPAISAASLTQIPAANLVGVCTSGLTRTGGFGGGKILQVVQKVLDVDGASYFSTSSQSFVEITGLAQTLTLASSSNKVLIEVNLHTVVMGASNMRSRSQLRFGDFASADGLSTNLCGVYNVTGSSGTEYVYVPHTHRVLHTPATASPTYRMGITLVDSGQSLYVYADGNVDGMESSVTFMEVEV